MKIVHIESGLGNQMLSYCELLALRAVNPADECMVETIIYDIPEAGKYISQWNGYELERIFGIKEKNISALFAEEEWNEIIDEVAKSKFWEKKWNYPPYIVSALNRHGLKIKNIRGDFEVNGPQYSIASKGKPPLAFRIKQTGVYDKLRQLRNRMIKNPTVSGDLPLLFYEGKEDIYTGQRLLFWKKGSQRERIEQAIKQAFVFPDITDVKNLEIVRKLQEENSVAIHARRGDALSTNEKYYKRGYFRKATKYIKAHVENPVFYFFSDPGSCEWCRNNLKVFGINSRDKVYFVDWNSGTESFRDMQLMSLCKHNIISDSSFGWWGAFLNQNETKITISPEVIIDTTVNL